jgi:hypothetical protein
VRFAAVPFEWFERALDQEPMHVLHRQKVQMLRLEPGQPCAAEQATETALRIGHLDEQESLALEDAGGCVEFGGWIERVLR